MNSANHRNREKNAGFANQQSENGKSNNSPPRSKHLANIQTIGSRLRFRSGSRQGGFRAAVATGTLPPSATGGVSCFARQRCIKSWNPASSSYEKSSLCNLIVVLTLIWIRGFYFDFGLFVLVFY